MNLATDYETIYKEEFPRLVQLVARWTPDHGLAEDVAQATMLKIWINRDRYNERGRLKGWIRVIARNEYISRIRHLSRSSLIDPINETDAVQLIEDPRNEIRDFESKDYFEYLIAELSSKDQHIARLKWELGMTRIQIGKIKGMKFGTVSSRLTRIHQQLRFRVVHDGY